RLRPLEANDIDQLVRSNGGCTAAVDMEPLQMWSSKRHESAEEYIETLSRINGYLRLEITFYRECFRHAEVFRDTVTQISQELLHQSIISLIADISLNDIRDISRSICTAVDNLQAKQKVTLQNYVS
ncbi:hypothetical protein BU24DRAFT_328654, partial [Aaosphaeria arxii CBS 175.79]